MKKKIILLSGIFLTTGLVASVLPFVANGNLFVKAATDDWEPHQIVLTAEDTSVESESLHTHYFKLHQDNATRSGYSIDSKPEECLIMADSETSAGGDHICYGEVNPQSGTYACLYLTIPLTSLKVSQVLCLEALSIKVFGQIKLMKFSLEAKVIVLFGMNLKFHLQRHIK